MSSTVLHHITPELITRGEYNRPKKIEASQAFAKAILDLKDPKYGFKLYQYAFDEVYVFDGTTPYNAGVNYKREYNRPKKIEASQAFAKAILDLKDPKYGFELYQYAFDEVYVFDGITRYNAGVNYKREYNRPKKIEVSQAFAKEILEIEDAREAFERFKVSYAKVSSSDEAVQEALDTAKAGP